MEKQRTPYTTSEDEFIKKHYRSYTYAWISNRLERSVNSVERRAMRLGLTKKSKGLSIAKLSELVCETPRKVKEWINNHQLPATRKSNQYCINPEEFWVWANKNRILLQFSNIKPLSIPKEPSWVEEERSKEKQPRKSKRFTAEEDDFLYEHFGFRNIKWMAKKLGRTEKGIFRRAERLGLNITNQTGMFSLSKMASIIHKDHRKIKEWIDSGELKAIKNNHIFLIDPLDFWRFAENNKEKINFMKIESNTLHPEPLWVEGERRKQRKKKTVRTQEIWTDEEDNRIWKYYYTWQLTHKEIGEHVNRSRRAVQKRLEILREKKYKKNDLKKEA